MRACSSSSGPFLAPSKSRAVRHYALRGRVANVAEVHLANCCAQPTAVALGREPAHLLRRQCLELCGSLQAPTECTPQTSPMRICTLQRGDAPFAHGQRNVVAAGHGARAVTCRHTLQATISEALLRALEKGSHMPQHEDKQLWNGCHCFGIRLYFEVPLFVTARLSTSCSFLNMICRSLQNTVMSIADGLKVVQRAVKCKLR